MLERHDSSQSSLFSNLICSFLFSSQGTGQLPTYGSVLLSLSGDSKISLQHTSVQHLSAIPEDKELNDVTSYYSFSTAGGIGGPNGNHLGDDLTSNAGDHPGMAVEENGKDGPNVFMPDPAPDGGYGWFVVFSAFMCNLIVDGIAYTFGLFFEQFLLHFMTSRGKVALVGSLLNGCYLTVGMYRFRVYKKILIPSYFVPGPIVSSLVNRYGCQVVVILGAVIGCLGFLLSTIAPNIETLMITYGVVGGVGFGMIYLPTIVSVGYYFSTKRAFATGVAVCGSGMGAFLFAPFCQFLLSVTTWQNTLVILGLLILSCGVFGWLMRPIDVHAETILKEDNEVDNLQSLPDNRKPLLQRIAEEKRRRLLARSNSSFLLMMQNGSIDINDETFNELRARLTMNTEPGVHSTLYLDQLFQETPAQTPTPTLHSANPSSAMLDKPHQLSPILERKVSSNERLISEDENEETITFVAKPANEVGTAEEKLLGLFEPPSPGSSAKDESTPKSRGSNSDKLLNGVDGDDDDDDDDFKSTRGDSNSIYSSPKSEITIGSNEKRM